MRWHPGKIYYFDLISSPFEFEKTYIWDDVKYVTCTGWTTYSETLIDSYEHFDKIAKLGAALYQTPIVVLSGEYWIEN
jgi:hypothetical protein